jgi:CDP-diacylglycerol--glycerol-3-phosphate 3-phosphatidyltransferase
VSSVRVVLAPVIVLLILSRSRPADYLAACVLLLAAGTDGLDGYLARHHGARTRTGQWLDPLADKVVVGAPLLALVAVHRFPLWALAVILFREAAVSALRVFLGVRGRAMPASSGAKVKTTLQLLAITLYILPLAPSTAPLKLAVLLAAVALTVATGLAYGVETVRWVRSPAGRRGAAVPETRP